MARKKTWYQEGYDDARAGLNCDAPSVPGNNSFHDYREGHRDGLFSLQRDLDRERAAQDEED